MAYVNERYYRRNYKGKYQGEDLGQFLCRAHCLVDMLTHGRIQAVGFGNLTKYQQGAVRKSVCLMVDYFANLEGVPAANLSSYSLGGVRVSQRVRKEKPWEVAGCGMWAWHMLMSTGLMRGVA